MSMVPWPKRRSEVGLAADLARAEAAIANTVKHEFRPSSQPRPAAQIAADIDANDAELQITKQRLAEFRETSERRLAEIGEIGVALRIELTKSLEAIHEHTQVLRSQYLGGHNASNHHDSAATVDGNGGASDGQAGSVPGVSEPTTSDAGLQGQEGQVPADQG